LINKLFNITFIVSRLASNSGEFYQPLNTDHLQKTAVCFNICFMTTHGILTCTGPSI